MAKSRYDPWQIRGPDRKGFTLVELLVVLAIMMLILTAAPALYSAAVPAVRVREEAGKLAADLRLLRNMAVVSGRRTEAVLDLEEWRYSVSMDTRIRALADKVSMSFQGPHDTEETGAEAVIRFFPDGSSSGGRIGLSHGKREAHVDVSWLTGRVSVGD